LEYETPEVERFREAYGAIDVAPARVASARRSTDPEPQNRD
jgi:hypothetical protein